MSDLTQTLTIATTGVAQLFPYMPRLFKTIRFTVLATNKNPVFLGGPPGIGTRLYPSNPNADYYNNYDSQTPTTVGAKYRDEYCKSIQQAYESLDLALYGNAGDGVTYTIYGGGT